MVTGGGRGEPQNGEVARSQLWLLHHFVRSTGTQRNSPPVTGEHKAHAITLTLTAVTREHGQPLGSLDLTNETPADGGPKSEVG